jgi:hypothetical protein
MMARQPVDVNFILIIKCGQRDKIYGILEVRC